MVVQSAAVGLYENYSQLVKANTLNNMQDNRKVEDVARQQLQQFVSSTTNYYSKEASQQRTQELNGNLGNNVNLFA
jgi:hypothetical protein